MCWQRTVALKPGFAEACTTLSMMLYGLGRIEEATAVVKQWLQSDPESRVARHLVAAFTGQDVPARASDEYIRSTFDHFATSSGNSTARVPRPGTGRGGNGQSARDAGR